MKNFVFLILFFISSACLADEATLTVVSQGGEATVFSSEVKLVNGFENPLICDVTQKRLMIIEESLQKIEYIHKKISGELERWRHRKYLEELVTLEEKIKINFDFLGQRKIELWVIWDVRGLAQDQRDQIFMEEVDSSLTSEVLTMETYGNLQFPKDLAHINVNHALNGYLQLILRPTLQEYCYSDMGVELEIGL